MTAMRIEIRIARGAARQWHETLCKRLRLGGHRVWFAWVEASPPSIPGLTLLTRLEAMIYAGARAGAGEAWEPGPTDEIAEAAADIVIDLTNADPAPAKTPGLSPRWDACASETGAIAALLDRRSPRLEVVLRRLDNASATLCAAGLAALEKPEIFTYSFDSVCGRMCDLIVQAVRRLEGGAATGIFGAATRAPSIAALTPLSFVMRSLAHKIASRLTRLAKQGPQWRIGWRRTNDDLVIDTKRWPTNGYKIVPDDGQRYFADPFVFRHAGVSHVFCEEFPFATQRGILSSFTISDDGVASTPRPVLECAYHLSYPMIFAQGEAIYMIPETSANRTIELWRAERFPDRWVREAVLIDNIVASDATLIEQGGLFWIFATIASSGESTWDALGLFSAERLTGPWHAHPGNPVHIDAGAARPAGMMVQRNGRLLRPAQNCMTGYGAGLSLCVVERLDAENFAQKVIAALPPPPGLRASGAHTLNARHSLEVIDFFGPLPDAIH